MKAGAAVDNGLDLGRAGREVERFERRWDEHRV
jgi:hypothetical protein